MKSLFLRTIWTIYSLFIFLENVTKQNNTNNFYSHFSQNSTVLHQARPSSAKISRNKNCDVIIVQLF